MTDHLAAATSSLLELVDKRELAVLGEMYDISTAGRSFHSGPPTSPENSSDAESDLPAAFAVSVPSPKRAPFFFPTSITPSRLVDQQVDDFSSSPMTASRSLPGQPRTRQLPFATRPQLPGEDRFTLLPSRTPRISKRSSWDAEAWRAVQSEESAQRPRHARRITEADEDEGEDDTVASLGESLPPAVQSPFSPRFSSPLSRHQFDDTPMITPPRTALLDLSLNGTIARPTTSSATSSKRSAQTRPTSIASSSALHHRQSPESLLSSPFSRNDQIASMPVSPTYAHQSTPNAKRRSLQLANRHHRQSHSLSIPASANPKRRSLQNMHYYPPDPTIGTPGADLTRANSMPSSELQAVRAASATGSRRSSGASQRPDDWSIATPAANRRLKRITSISPLTTPGLKAGCLGLHLRRRRVGCCLLGLRFEDTDAYWEEVNSVLSELERGVTTELHALKAALGAVSQRRVMANDVPSLLPPWASASTARNSGCDTDFAPRDSDEALLASRISESRRALMDAWRHLDETEAALRSNLAVDSSWTELRESIGAMVRAWEKGREAARRVSAAAEEPGVGVDHNDLSDVGEPTLTGVPDFIATWRGASDEDTGSTSLDTDRPLSSAAEDEHEHGPVVDLAEHVTDDGAQEQEQEQLPPPGEDVLYEAVSQAGEFLSKGKVALREMSRDARIRLAKQARERGMPLADLLDLEESAAAGARREAERMREAGDRVVQELRGMMGLIKDKKRSRGGWKARQAEADGASQAEIDGGSLEAADPSQVEFDPPAEDDGVPQAELLTRSEFSEAMPVNARVGTLTPSGRMERVSGSQRVSVTEVMGVAHVSLEGEHVSRRLQGRGLGFVFPALSRAADEA
nr:protein phosphatase methylesterase 1 [Naematelia aurantialba]